MPYTDHFRLTDDLIAHLDPVLAAVRDPFVESRYTGFLSVSAVTVFELAIKDIFREFARGKHKVLENFTNEYFERINGRIKIAAVRDDYVKKYGSKYVTRFDMRLRECEQSFLRSHGCSLRAAYGNLIEWRGDFCFLGGEGIPDYTYEQDGSCGTAPGTGTCCPEESSYCNGGGTNYLNFYYSSSGEC